MYWFRTNNLIDLIRYDLLSAEKEYFQQACVDIMDQREQENKKESRC
jgi:hypothetical protein